MHSKHEHVMRGVGNVQLVLYLDWKHLIRGHFGLCLES